MTVLAYENHHDLADMKAVWGKVKLFAEAQGWTVVSYQTSKQWASIGGGSFGFIAGSEDFLHITSSGFGAQTLQFRIRIRVNPAQSLDGLVEIYGHKGSTSYNTSSSTHPAAQTSPSQLWTIRPENSFPNQLVPETWIFGNNKFLLVVCKVDDEFIVSTAFGTVELYDSAEVEGDFYAWRSASYGTAQHWYNHGTIFPLDNCVSDCLYYDGARKSTTAGLNFVLTSGNGFTSSKFGSYGQAVLRNLYSDLRPIFKQKMYVQKASDSRYRRLGPAWIYRLNTQGLLIGQRLKLGSDEYICFPQGLVNSQFQGFAVRV